MKQKQLNHLLERYGRYWHDAEVAESNKVFEWSQDMMEEIEALIWTAISK